MSFERQPNSYDFESHVFQDSVGQTDAQRKSHLENLNLDPKEYFVEIPRTEKEKYELHRSNRRLLMEEENFLGSGNDGFVTSMETSPDSYACIKFVWNRLEVVPGAEMKTSDLDAEMKRLAGIAEYFKTIRQTNQRITAETGRASIAPNDVATEAMLQDKSRKILEEAGINCRVPRVIEIDSFSETEEDFDPYSYCLYDSYSTITMEQIRGKSIQDLILNYPENAEYLDSIDIDAFEDGLSQALEALHENKIKHRDITIRNVMVDFDQSCPVIIDFGKAGYGEDVSSAEDEIANNLAEVINHLRAFLRDPVKKRGELLSEFEIQARRMNI